MRRAPKILISAGEASGDRLGAGLARELRASRPDIELIGMGGDEMAEAGVRLVQHASEVAVVGIFEALAQLPSIRRAMRRLDACLREERPDLVVPVDFPDFNLGLAARACRLGIEVVYFVSPQVWAWRRRRVRRIRRLVRRMLVLFPFETRFYEEAGVPVSFVGHPAVEEAGSAPEREAVLRRAGLAPERPVVALLPGSRRGEVSRLLPPMLAAARELRRHRPELQFLIPRARMLSEDVLAGEVGRSGLDGVRIHSGDYPGILTACGAGAVASGTASLESALAGLPMVVVYRMQPLSYLIGRLLVRIEHVALPNLVVGRRVVPELVQSRCTPAAIAAALAGYLDDPRRASRVREELGEVRRRLGGPGAYARAARAVLAELGAPSRAPGRFSPADEGAC
jgi:lipid-A-disaccharide synthase